ncbi:hypothetical protein CHCC14814_2988 [Bacillus paralicheniformis]|nr:hypothetical protein CHCC14814_2988 [Bacillus paralicheniformis]
MHAVNKGREAVCAAANISMRTAEGAALLIIRYEGLNACHEAAGL